MHHDSYQATVDKVVPNGKHGSYAVARCQELGCITFSLNSNVWKESEYPEPGMCVVLSQLRKKRAGWRAQQGRFFKPSDQQPATRMEQ